MKTKIPIKIKSSSGTSEGQVAENEPAVTEAAPPVEDKEPVTVKKEADVAPVAPAAPEPQPEEAKARAELEEELETWRDRALRLQAEIENFRKRQRRLAQERVEADRERLLRNFLQVADDLKRALDTDGADDNHLREGIEVTYRSLRRVLEQEGVERIEAKGEPFDPLWHEAISTIPHQGADVEPDTVVEVVQEGYRLDERLLRPARVVVAT
jgi:molecular chaperone GrpE